MLWRELRFRESLQRRAHSLHNFENNFLETIDAAKRAGANVCNPQAFRFGAACTASRGAARGYLVSGAVWKQITLVVEEQEKKQGTLCSPCTEGKKSSLSHPGQSVRKPPQGRGAPAHGNWWLLIKPRGLAEERKAALCPDSTQNYPSSPLSPCQRLPGSRRDPDAALSLAHGLKRRQFDGHSCLPAAAEL